MCFNRQKKTHRWGGLGGAYKYESCTESQRMASQHSDTIN